MGILWLTIKEIGELHHQNAYELEILRGKWTNQVIQKKKNTKLRKTGTCPWVAFVLFPPKECIRADGQMMEDILTFLRFLLQNGKQSLGCISGLEYLPRVRMALQWDIHRGISCLYQRMRDWLTLAPLYQRVLLLFGSGFDVDPILLC